MNAPKSLSICSAVILGIAHSTLAISVIDVGNVGGTGAVSGLSRDAAGNMYGTTGSGGSYGYGSIFEIKTPNSKPVTIFSFRGSNGGSYPSSDLTADAAGNLYGVTNEGGSSNLGTVFELGSDQKTLTNLATFNGNNGSFPAGGLVADAAGNLYGTTIGTGAVGTATVFELSGANHQTFTTLATFTGPSNQGGPNGDLMIDRAGNLYGGTAIDGLNTFGSVFELSGSDHKTLTTLVNFNNTNGNDCNGFLRMDSAGNIFGTTQGGGIYDAGTLFELSGSNHLTLTTLYSFNDALGFDPLSGVTFDAAGNLFGTTQLGGSNEYGSAFELSADHLTMKSLINFTLPIYRPDSYLLPDASGNLYGTAVSGHVFGLISSGFVVPEPSSFSLPTMCVGVLLRRRKR